MPKALHIAMNEDGMLTVALTTSVRFSQPRFWFREIPGHRRGYGETAALAFPVLQNAIRQLPHGAGIGIERFTVQGEPA